MVVLASIQSKGGGGMAATLGICFRRESSAAFLHTRRISKNHHAAVMRGDFAENYGGMLWTMT